MERSASTSASRTSSMLIGPSCSCTSPLPVVVPFGITAIGRPFLLLYPVVGGVGIEPTTSRLKVERSTSELPARYPALFVRQN